MTTSVQRRRGTTAQHSTFTGLEGEITIDTTKDTAVIHDGSTVGGFPLAKENLSNTNPSTLTAITGAGTATDDLFLIYDASAGALKKITRAELNDALEQDALANVTITGGSINGTAIGGSTASSGAFTSLTSSSTTTLNGTTIPASSTLLVSTDIGTTVQGYDADLANWALKAAPSGDAVGTTDTQTLTNKTINLTSNTLTGTIAQFNTALSDADFATLAGSESLSNKTITSSSLNSTPIGASSASTGAFTTLSASSTISGSGFSTYLASPPAIGGSAPAAISSTNLAYTGTLTGGTGVVNLGSGQFYKDASGNVGIGTSSPASKFVVSNAGAGGIEIIPTGTVQSYNRSTAAYQTLYFDASTFLFRPSGTERMRIDSSGNVQIGTTTQIGKVTVNGNIISDFDKVIGFSYFPSPTEYNKGFTGLSLANANARGLHIFNYDVDSNQGINFYPNNYAGQTANPAVTIASGGNVGIGTSTPAVKVEIGGTGVLRLTNASGDAQLQLKASGTNPNYISYNLGGAGAMAFYDSNAGAERMRIGSNGNISIGTTDTNNSLLQLTRQTTGTKLLLNGDEGAGNTDGIVLTYGTATISNYRVQIGMSSYAGFIGMRNSSNTQTVNITATGDSYFNGGNVGIGITAPLYKLDVKGATGDIVRVADGTNGDLLLGTNSTGPYVFTPTAVALRFGTNNNERMRIDSSGNLLVGKTTTALNTAGCNFGAVSGAITSAQAGPALYLNKIGANGDQVYFYNATTLVGYIGSTSTTTSYNTSSDYRLKENIAPMQNALDVVQQLKPVTYNWKADGSSGQGFIAHELQAVVPDCVTGEKDAVDEEGKPVYQGIDVSFLVATLTAAIQELKSELDVVKAELNTLKGK